MTGNPRIAMVFDMPYLQNEFGDPQFVYVFYLILSFSTCGQSFKKICTCEVLGVNILNWSNRDSFLTHVAFFTTGESESDSELEFAIMCGESTLQHNSILIRICMGI